jgi:hypothetical protein
MQQITPEGSKAGHAILLVKTFYTTGETRRDANG